MIDKSAINITSKNNDTSEIEYWSRKTPILRILALEELRKEYIKWKHDSEPGFQRVYKIIKLKES